MTFKCKVCRNKEIQFWDRRVRGEAKGATKTRYNRINQGMRKVTPYNKNATVSGFITYFLSFDKKLIWNLRRYIGYTNILAILRRKSMTIQTRLLNGLSFRERNLYRFIILWYVYSKIFLLCCSLNIMKLHLWWNHPWPLFWCHL